VRAAALLHAGAVSVEVTSWSEAVTTATEVKQIYVPGMAAISCIVLTSALRHALQMLEAAVDAGHPRAFFLLGSIAEYGGDDVAADFTRAALLYSAGCWEKARVEASMLATRSLAFYPCPLGFYFVCCCSATPTAATTWA